ncbi:MAG: hypothetical protein NXI19_16730 [Alphaproteobacteria bacterium]|nr:hypothetical protein [Alphaproteobacteria bacterium]
MIEPAPRQLTIGITNGPDTAGFAAFAIETALAMARHPERIRFLITIPSDADPAPFHDQLARPGVEFMAVSNADLPDGFMHNGSAHCRALQRLLEAMDTPLGLFCDCDIAFVASDWDLTLERRLSPKTPMIGAGYPAAPVEFYADLTGRPEPAYKYQGFPNVIACMFLVDRFRDLGVDFGTMERLAKAKEAEVIVIEDPDICALVGIPEGGRWFVDSGFDLPLRLRKAGADGVPLTYVPARDGTVLGPLVASVKSETDRIERGTQSEEYHLDGAPIFAHFRKASRRGFGSTYMQHWLAHIRAHVRTAQTDQGAS